MSNETHDMTETPFTPSVVDQFNELFAGHVGVWVDADGAITFKTWDKEITIHDGRVTGMGQCQYSRMTVPGWLDMCKNPSLSELIPWSNAECDAVRAAIKSVRNAEED